MDECLPGDGDDWPATARAGRALELTTLSRSLKTFQTGSPKADVAVDLLCSATTASFSDQCDAVAIDSTTFEKSALP